jgi:hypothetical protein
MIFGPESRFRVWLILDGDILYLDPSGDAFPRMVNVFPATCPIELTDADGSTRYTIVSARPSPNEDPPRLLLVVDIAGAVQYRQYGIVKFGDQPESSGAAHIHGPLRVHIREGATDPPSLAFVLNGKLQSIQAMVTTGPPNNGSWIGVSTEAGKGVSSFPVGVCPEVVIDFPTRNTEKPSVSRRYALDKVC